MVWVISVSRGLPGMSARCNPGMDRAWSPVLDTSARAGMIKTEVRDDHPEWSRLMAAAQDGDAGAYQKLLHDITPLLRRVAARRLDHAPAADVEDVVIAPAPSSNPDGCRNTSGSLHKAGATKMTHDTITTAGIHTAKATLEIAVHGRPECWQFGSVVVFASVAGAFARWLLSWRGISTSRG